MTGVASLISPQGEVSYLRDPDRSLGLADVTAPDAAFAPLDRQEANFGYTTDRIWLRFRVTNSAAEDGQWVLLFNTNFLPTMAVHLVTETGVATTLDQTRTSVFSSRPVQLAELAAPLALTAGQSGMVYVAYTSDGSSGVGLRIMPNPAFEAQRSTTLAKDFGYFGMMLLLACLGVLAFLATRQITFLAYSGFALAILFYVMHRDGYTFQFFWPNAPLFNGNASILVGQLVILSAATYTRAFLRTPRLHPEMDWILAIFMGLTASTLLLWPLGMTQQIKQALILLSLTATILFLAAGINAARSRAREVRFFVIGWVFFVCSAAILSGRHLLNIDIPASLALDSIRVVTVFDAAFMGLAILDRYLQARRAEEQALRQSVDAMTARLDMQGRLERLEAQYSALQVSAARGGERLAEAAHDLRQPIHALRLSIQSLLSDTRAAPDLADRVERSFGYLEGLVQHALSREPGQTAPAAPVANDVLSALGEMFSEDAQTKQLELTVMPCAAPVSADPVLLLRILSNLVSNAIRYTESGRILVGCRRRAGRLRFEIHDTGPGMSAAEFAAALKRGVRLRKTAAQAHGSGLGLAIAAAEAQGAGMTLHRLNRRSGGLSLALDLPAQTPGGARHPNADAGGAVPPGGPDPAAPPAAASDRPAAIA
ncbi:MAG: sensor histidine kinase [Pseudomonadota bacterium]